MYQYKLGVWKKNKDILTFCMMIDIVLVEQSQSLLIDKCKNVQEISSDLCPGILIQPSNNSLEPYIGQRGKLEQLFFPLRIMKHLKDVREKFIKGYF